jgi:predicted O-linked N-acetylglucosamine transferase (SPINDLY family)
LPCFYCKPPDASIPTLSKTELGLPETGTLYGCPQNLFKLHPDFDAVMAAIADGDPAGHMILPEGKYSAWTDLLKARWAKTFPVLLERVVFLPRMSWERFMAAMAQMDVLLDPLHFGSGNTFYDAMVTGTPVVTWPGRFARGRNVAAAYRQMGVADAPVARHLEEYAPLALALGRDMERRQALRTASLEASDRELFEDMQAVREFEAFLEAAVAAAANGEKLPTSWRSDIRTDSAPFTGSRNRQNTSNN